MNFTHSVRICHDGIVRWYHCDNGTDANVLFDALTRVFRDVQLWRGMDQLRSTSGLI